jgi:hypothetical protein
MLRYLQLWPLLTWGLIMFFMGRSEEVPMPKVDELVRDQMIAPFQPDEWVTVMDMVVDPEDDYYRLVKVGYPDWDKPRSARLPRDLEIEVR